jgi:hypothetical protein
MRRTLSLSVVCLVTLAAGCGNEESSSEGSAKKPANMCEAVAPALPEDWELTKTPADKSKAKTDCTLAHSGGGTTLVVSLVKPRSGSVDDAFKELCDTYIGNPQEQDDEECTKTGPVKVEGSPAELQRGVRLDGSEGVLWLTFRTKNPDHAAGAENMMDDVQDAVSEK